MKTDRAAEMLAHCLGGTIDHRRVPGHSHNSLTPSDIAASLHAVSDRAGRLLLQVKHLGLWNDLNALERILLIRIAGVARHFGWRTKPHILGNLIYQALDNVIPANKCPVCKGTKCVEATETTPRVECAICEGTGDRPPLSAHTRAKKLGVSVEDFKKIYSRYLIDITNIITDIEAAALSELGAYLSDG